MLTVYIDNETYRFPLLCNATNALSWAIIKGEEIGIIGIVDGSKYDVKFQVIDYLRLTDTPWETIHLVTSGNWIMRDNEHHRGNLGKYLVCDCPYHTNNPYGGEPIVPNTQCPKCDPYR